MTALKYMDSRLRIGIVGAGNIVRDRHLPVLKKIPNVEITAVCNSTLESSKAFCEKYLPEATPLQHWVDLISSPDVDAIWIGTPPFLHSSVTVSALEAGKHVFCQARMAMNFPEAEEMLAAARRHPELTTMLCPAPHGLKGDMVMRKLLADEVIGSIHEIRLQSLNAAYLDPTKPAHWRQRDEISGYNVLTLGMYIEVLDRWLGSFHSVFAHSGIVTRERQGYEVHIPDWIHVLASFTNGAHGTLTFSGVAAHAPTDRLELYGTEGTLIYDFKTDEIWLGSREHKDLHLIPIPPELAVQWHVEEDFVLAVRSHGQLQPRPTFEEGVEYMRVIQAISDSLLTQQEISVL